MNVWIAQYGFPYDSPDAIAFVAPDDEEKAFRRFCRLIEDAKAEGYEGPESVRKTNDGSRYFSNKWRWFSLERHPVEEG